MPSPARRSGSPSTLRWFINALNSWANWLVRRLGVEPADELASARSPQELGSLVRTSAARGTIDPGTATLLDRSLRFGDRSAEELMTPRVQVESLPTDATVLDLIELARRTGYSRFPVHEGDLDDVRGVVHVKQAFSVPVDQRAATRISKLAQPVQTVPESLDGDTLLDRLRGSGLQLAVVVDEYGGTAGLVTLEDLVEEIVGDVRDEHDRGEVNPVRPLGRDSWMVSGLLREDELADATGFRMPPGDYETLAGLVLARLGRIPEVNDEVRIDGWRITVMAMDRHRVAELRVARIPDTERVEDRQEVAADDRRLVAILVAVFLLILNAFFVGAEFALVSARRDRLEAMADRGVDRARIVMRAAEHTSMMMAGAQLGITLCTIGLGALGEPTVAHFLEVLLGPLNLPAAVMHALAFTIALVFVSILHIVLGEMVTKNIAIAAPEQTAIWLTPVLVGWVRLIRPVIALLNASANGVLRLLKVRAEGRDRERAHAGGAGQHDRGLAA